LGGKGIDSLVLGMEIEAIRALMRVDGTLNSHEKEYEAFDKFGYTPQHFLQFLLGFEEVLVFDDDDSPRYPVFKIYMNQGKAMFMMITTYGTGTFDIEKGMRIFTDKGLSFGDPLSDLKQRYGNDFAFYKYGEYDGEFMYLKEGISFLFEKGKLRVMRIFEPFDKEKAEDVKDFFLKLRT
jgi:hypothetical protein